MLIPRVSQRSNLPCRLVSLQIKSQKRAGAWTLAFQGTAGRTWDWFTVLPKDNVSHRVKWCCISITSCYCRSPSRLLLPQTGLNIMWLGEQINAKLCDLKETTDRCWSQKVKRNALRCLQRQGGHCELYAVCGDHHRVPGLVLFLLRPFRFDQCFHSMHAFSQRSI